MPEKEIEDLSKYSHFYWMSISSFKEALKRFPSIENAEHSCGLGKTFDELNKLYPNKIKPFLNYERLAGKSKRSKVSYAPVYPIWQILKKISSF